MTARCFFLTRWLYLRLLGLSSLVAFVSLISQMNGLFLSGGILPAAQFMDSVSAYADGQHWGALRRLMEVPTLAWLSVSDGALHAFAIAGVVGSVLLILDVAPGLMAACLWLLYLSLVKVGGVFFLFQWDSLLLETLLVSLFVAPWRVLPRATGDAEPPLAGLWLVRLLLFKLMFLSGVVKLMAHDDTWTSLAALDVHFFTQPLPTWSAYYAHFAPHWLHVAALLVMFAVELVLPFLVFGPRRARTVFGLGCMFLMLMIGLTGNYGFFNLLTCTLAVLCLDDALVGRVLPLWLRNRVLVAEPTAALRPRLRFRQWLTWAGASSLLSLSALQMLYRLEPETQWGRVASDAIDPFLSINSYGLFQDMTSSRPEIVIEGSRDGRTWEAYDFEYNPGDPSRRPAFAGPLMPRLDWQMWFAALSGCERSYWFQRFLGRLFEGAPAVEALLARAPFGPDNPPLYLRTTLYDYRFATPGSSNWWTRSEPRTFCPLLKWEGQTRATTGD